MNFTNAQDKNTGIGIGDIAGLHDIHITLTVQNHEALWDAAAAKLSAVGLAEDEIADCIGDRADISLNECLTTLIMPLALPGCTLTDVAVRGLIPNLDRFLQAATQTGDAGQRVDFRARNSPSPDSVYPSPATARWLR
jgi:hypothetical protein